MATNVCRAFALFLGVLCSTVWAVDTRRNATPPTVADTNVFVQSGNTYRKLVSSSLVWKSAPSPECMSVKARVEMMAAPLPLIDTASIDPRLLTEVAQRAEEGTYGALYNFSAVLYEGVRANCFSLPKG